MTLIAFFAVLIGVNSLTNDGTAAVAFAVATAAVSTRLGSIRDHAEATRAILQRAEDRRPIPDEFKGPRR